MRKDKIVFRSVGKSKQITVGAGDIRVKSQEHSQEENLGGVSMIKNANGSFKSFSSPSTKKQSSPYFNKNNNNLVQMTLNNFFVKKDLKTLKEEGDSDDNLKEETPQMTIPTPSDSDVENSTQETKLIQTEGINEIPTTTDQPSQQYEINTSKQTDTPKSSSSRSKRTTKKTSPTQNHKKTTKMRKTKKSADPNELSDEEMQEEEEILQITKKRKNMFEEFAYESPKKQKIGMPIQHSPQSTTQSNGNVKKKSQNVKEDDKDSGDENEDDVKAEALSAYELQRLQNIQKNRELMVCEKKKNLDFC